MTRLRSMLALLVCAGLATVMVACGGSEDEEVTADADPQAVLDRTFGPESAVESAAIDSSFDVEAEGAEQGTMTIEADGAVAETEAANPDMDLELSMRGNLDGEDVDFTTGFVTVGDEVYISLDGQQYQLDDALVGQIEQQSEQIAPGDGEGQDPAGLFGDLDIPEMLTDLSNEGTEDVEGVETVHVSGTVDTTRAVEELQGVLGSTAALEGLGLDVPGVEDLQDVEESVGNITFDIYSGADDGLLRRLDFTVPVEDEQSSGSFTGSVVLSDVNEPQDIEAPENAGNFMELIEAIGDGALDDLGIEGLGDLGALGGGGGGFGGGFGSGGSAPDGGADGAGGSGSADGAGSGSAPGQGDALGELDGALDNVPQEALDCLQDAQSPADIAECQQMIE